MILSGSDPSVLHDTGLAKLISQFEAIPHIERLRIHTRLPVVIPSRINDDLIELINYTKLKVVIVLLINHAQEIDSQLQNKLQELSNTRYTLLN